MKHYGQTNLVIDFDRPYCTFTFYLRRIESVRLA
jgi:hypothetical protein